MSEDLLAHLRQAYGIAARRLIRLPGADRQAQAYRVDSEAATWFVKVRPGHVSDEVGVRVAEHLAGLGLSELRTPVASRVGTSVTELDGTTVVVWPWREGRSGFEARHTEGTLRRVGSVLRAVHDLGIPAELSDVVPVNDPSDRWRRAVTHWYATDWYAAGAPTGDHLVDQLVRLLERHRRLVLGLVAATAQLESDLPKPPPELVLCHGDLHAGNVLVDTGGRVTIIDWDSAVLGDRERDLMFAGAAIAGAWSDESDVAAFSTGYGALPGRSIDPTVIAFYRGDRVLADVALFTAQILDPTDEDRPRALRLLSSALGPGEAAETAARTIAALR